MIQSLNTSTQSQKQETFLPLSLPTRRTLRIVKIKTNNKHYSPVTMHKNTFCTKTFAMRNLPRQCETTVFHRLTGSLLKRAQNRASRLNVTHRRPDSHQMWLRTRATPTHTKSDGSRRSRGDTRPLSHPQTQLSVTVRVENSPSSRGRAGNSGWRWRTSGYLLHISDHQDASYQRRHNTSVVRVLKTGGAMQPGKHL